MQAQNCHEYVFSLEKRVHVVEDDDLPDGIEAKWSQLVVAKHVEAFVERHKIDHVKKHTCYVNYVC